MRRSSCHREASPRRPAFMLHAGLDLSRRKVDVCLMSGDEVIDEWASPPDADGLRGLAAGAAMWGPVVLGVVESMNGAVRARPPRRARLGRLIAYYKDRYQHTKRRLGRRRGPKVAQIDLSRRLTGAICTCSPPTSPSLRQVPLSSSRLTAHFGHAPPDEHSHSARSQHRLGDRDMSNARHPQPTRGP